MISRPHITSAIASIFRVVSEAIGVARQPGPSTSPKLEVRFVPSWLSGLPFVWGKYWVIDLGKDYRSVVASKYLIRKGVNLIDRQFHEMSLFKLID